ncbi:alpha/beta hydrolase [uncultured Dialister sp.]|uniref:alpha/beta hydrolase n=1 Tax=uncultured Dialister sp. TaxID=278064 RepID=UPI0025D18305|nr:alpha/beta hydrolase [uncultured Dialister sp.]
MKNLKKMKWLVLALAGLTLAGSVMTVDAADASSRTENGSQVRRISSTPWEGEESLPLTDSWDKTFPKSDKVDHEKVTFHNRYGITLAADLYMPKNRNGKMAALAVAGPFGAVKEQASGLYAQKLAEMGFLTIAFDPSFIGESGGRARNVASPDINTEDFSAAVDYLSNRSDVNPDKIGIVGICGFGGMAINAAAMDTRIKATVTSTMYDMSRVIANGYFDYEKDGDTLKKERMDRRKALNQQRTEDYKNGSYKRDGGVVDPLPADAPQFVKDYYDYYKTKRGYYPRSLNSNDGWNVTSALSFTNMPLLAYADEIESPVLIIHGEMAHSRYFSEDVFKKLKGNNKELLIVPGANHTDLYDNMDKIPFHKIAAFFHKYLG